MPFGLDFVWSVLPVVVSSVAPYITEGVKKAIGFAGKNIPTVVKPAVNIAVAAVLGALCGDAATGAAVGVGTSAAFAVGKRS
jgi:hypothetical protein